MRTSKELSWACIKRMAYVHDIYMYEQRQKKDGICRATYIITLLVDPNRPGYPDLSCSFMSMYVAAACQIPFQIFWPCMLFFLRVGLLLFYFLFQKKQEFGSSIDRSFSEIAAWKLFINSMFWHS